MARPSKEMQIAMGRRLKQARSVLGLKEEPVAEKASTDAGSISHWEKGDRTPTVYNLAALAVVYGRSMEWFVTGVDATAEALGEEPTDQQVRAARVVGALPDEISDGYLQVMERLIPILQRLGEERRADDSSDSRELGKQQ